ncbi:MAG: hypothetical protein J0I28_09865 [Caulobacterales bacterium]|nr:hypothetical protein [Caulobacterales bacterium]
MAPAVRKWAPIGLAAVVLVLGVLVGFVLLKPKPLPAPPPPPPKWECGTAYGQEVCERKLPPARPAS